MQAAIKFFNDDYNINIESDTWINERTGERIEARTILKKVQRENFEIIYLSYMCDLFDRLGGQKYKVLKYLLAHKDYNNIILTTTRKLSEECKVSRSTVNETLKLLKEMNMITTRLGAIMINAKFMNRGSAKKEDYLIHKFEIFDK